MHLHFTRWGLGVALTCTVLVVVLLQTCALVLGVTSHSDKAPPTERSTASNTAGCCLIM